MIDLVVHRNGTIITLPQFRWQVDSPKSSMLI
jgi:hypothetical protein